MRHPLLRAARIGVSHALDEAVFAARIVLHGSRTRCLGHLDQPSPRVHEDASQNAFGPVSPLETLFILRAGELRGDIRLVRAPRIDPLPFAPRAASK